MELTKHSIARLKHSMSVEGVGDEFGDPIFNYLVHGLEPGSFFTSMLANDAREMIMRSHPSNSIMSIKSIVRWLGNNLTWDTGYGAYGAVEAWLELSDDRRRNRLEQSNLVYTAHEEVCLILQDAPLMSHTYDF